MSLTVDHLSSGNRVEDRELQRRIDARRYPKIEGTLDKIAPSREGGSYLVGGDIDFRGVSRATTRDVMSISNVDEQTIRLAGKSNFDIRDYGMEPPRILMLKVEPEVDIRVEIFATKRATGVMPP